MDRNVSPQVVHLTKPNRANLELGTWNLKISSWKRRNIDPSTTIFGDSLLVFGGCNTLQASSWNILKMIFNCEVFFFLWEPLSVGYQCHHGVQQTQLTKYRSLLQSWCGVDWGCLTR